MPMNRVVSTDLITRWRPARTRIKSGNMRSSVLVYSFVTTRGLQYLVVQYSIYFLENCSGKI